MEIGDLPKIDIPSYSIPKLDFNVDLSLDGINLPELKGITPNVPNTNLKPVEEAAKAVVDNAINIAKDTASTAEQAIAPVTGNQSC